MEKQLDFTTKKWLEYTYRKLHAINLLRDKLWTAEKGPYYADTDECRLVAILWDDAFREYQKVECDVKEKLQNEGMDEWDAESLIRDIEEDVEKHFYMNRELIDY